MPGISGIKLGQGGGRNPLQHFLGEDPQQLPSNVKRLEDSPVFITSLSNEVLLKLAQEFKIQEIIRCKGFLSYHSLHGLDILTNSIASVQLVRDVRVILPGHSFSNS